MFEGEQMKVFISSTYIDLKDYRQVAIEVVNRYKCTPLAMEFFMAQPGEPTKVAKKEVEECDIFVGIYAHRYGSIPRRQKKSITQQEYELAKELGKDCLCFIVAKDFPWNPELCEIKKYAKLQAFLKIVKKENVVAFFTTSSDFDAKSSASLGKLLIEKQGTHEQKKELDRGAKLIPIAPTPYIAHSYGLPENFTGREAEKSMLSNWFYNAAEPMLVLEAIGGMGKTALSWVWLNEGLLEKSPEIDGIIWWSFYEAPFETFIGHLYHYLTSREVKVERGALESGALATLNSILHENRFLLILDGFERALRGYSSMRAMYIQEKGLAKKQTAEAEWDRRQREPVHPHAAKFLKTLASGKTKTLMTTRLFPDSLEDIGGVQHEFLKGLSRTDAVRFLRSEGIEGSRAELERAGEIYDFHPLMLKQLGSAIKRKRRKDIRAGFDLNLIDEKEPQKILNKSFELLTEDEKRVATTISVFRSSFGFETAKALFPRMKEDTLWELLSGLQQLGFVFYDEKQDTFDFHPIMRSFLYDSLTAKDKVHGRAVRYFQAMPKPEEVVRLEDLGPLIELYHHLVGAGKFDEAFRIFGDRIHEQAYYQLSAYDLIIEIVEVLFSGGETRTPLLKEESDQAWCLAALANSYSLSGQPANAVALFLAHNQLRENGDDKKNLAIGLGNVASIQLLVGRLSAAAVHHRRRIALYRQVQDKLQEAVGHQGLGRVLAYQGRSTAQDELEKAFDLARKVGHIQCQGLTIAYRSLSALLQGRLAFTVARPKNDSSRMSLQALEEAHEALGFFEKWARTDYPMARDFVRGYCIVGESLIESKKSHISLGKKRFEIHFYDENFQEQTQSLAIKAGGELEVAERCLNEALRRCRKVNLAELEPDILLACARLEWVRMPAKQRGVQKLGELEETLKEAHEIAERAGYRLKLADIHLFCGEVLLEVPEGRLLDLAAREHLQKAKEYAKDVSEFSDLFKSKDPHFYDGIAEYKMLKRGMTEKERIENGYYVAYQIADALEKRLK
jgi:tetratricopeptide (TPR) repeat protein